MKRLFKHCGSVFVALAVGLVATVSLVGMTTAPAHADTARPVVGMKLKGGPGHSGTVYAYIWELNGQRGPCIDFGRRTPNGDGTKVIFTVPDMNKEESQRAFALVQKYRTTQSSKTAAALSLSVWVLRGDADFKTWYRWAKRTNAVSPELERRVNAMLAESKSHGPYKVSVQLDPVFKGQTGVGKVTVRDSRGMPARKMRAVVTRTTGAAKLVRKPGLTSKNGVATFKFKRTKNARVGFKATVRGPSIKKALLSQPSAGSQRLLVGGFNDSWSGSAEYESSAGKPTFSTVCDTDCDGEATVTIKYDSPARGTALRWVSMVGGKVVLQRDVPRGKSVTSSIRLRDGNVVTTKYCVLDRVGGKCRGKYVSTNKPYEIVCPAWPIAEIKIACTCKPDESGTVTFKGLLAGNPRYYTGYVIINEGTITRPVPLDQLDKVVEIGQIKKGTRIQVTYKVWRDAAKTQLLGEATLIDLTVNG